MADMIDAIITLVIGAIGLAIVAAVVTDAQDNLTGTALTVSNYIDVGFAIGLLVIAFKLAKG